MGPTAVWQDETFCDTYLRDVRSGLPLAEEQVQVIVFLLHQLSPRIGRYLDIGCGGGFVGAQVLRAFPDATGVFTDFSPPMLDAARCHLAPLPNGKHFVLADMAQESWAPALSGLAPFDAIVAGYSIHYQDDSRKRQLYHEIYELLSPGGVFINLEHVTSGSIPYDRLHDAYFVQSVHRFQHRTGHNVTLPQVEKWYEDRPQRHANRLTDLDPQLAWMRDTGFQEVGCFMTIFNFVIFGGIKPRTGHGGHQSTPAAAPDATASR